MYFNEINLFQNSPVQPLRKKRRRRRIDHTYAPRRISSLSHPPSNIIIEINENFKFQFLFLENCSTYNALEDKKEGKKLEYRLGV
jgi:hypothetical protein